MPPAGGARGRSVSFVGCGIGGVCVAARSAGEAVCCGAGRAGSDTGCVAAVPSCGGTEEGYCPAAAPTGDCPALPGVCTERGAVPPVSGGSCGPSGSKLFFFCPMPQSFISQSSTCSRVFVALRRVASTPFIRATASNRNPISSRALWAL